MQASVTAQSELREHSTIRKYLLYLLMRFLQFLRYFGVYKPLYGLLFELYS